MDAQQNRLILGMGNSRVDDIVLFRHEPGAVYPAVRWKSVFISRSSAVDTIGNPFRKPLEFKWSRWGGPLYKNGNPLDGLLKPYVEHTYHWAFNSWSDAVWQEFTLHGRKVGAPTFIVNVTHIPNYPGDVYEREFLSVWNQAWSVPCAQQADSIVMRGVPE